MSSKQHNRRPRVYALGRLIIIKSSDCGATEIKSAQNSGHYHKLAMSRRFFREIIEKPLDEIREQVLYSGDSPNDQPMFAYFPHSVGVANVVDFKNRMADLPNWITVKPGGLGFVEMVDELLR